MHFPRTEVGEIPWPGLGYSWLVGPWSLCRRESHSIPWPCFEGRVVVFDMFHIAVNGPSTMICFKQNCQLNRWVWVNTYRYIFSGMNIHLPAILGFTRYQGYGPSPDFPKLDELPMNLTHVCPANWPPLRRYQVAARCREFAYAM